jgi:hypothetical protein
MKLVSSVVLTAIVVGGGVYVWHYSSVKSLKNEKLSSASSLKNENLNNQQQLQGQIHELKAELKELKQTLQKKIEDPTGYYFKIYGADKGANYSEVNFYVSIPETIPKLEKLRHLADKLSRYKFRYLPISVLRIENRSNKEIAIVELIEKDPMSGTSWRSGFFQGSTGGSFTTITLTKTFLQEDYEGNWIDGIEFYYEGKPIGKWDWDHIKLSGTNYRQ